MEMKNGEVEVRKVLHFGSLNNVMMSVFGKSYEFGSGSGCGCGQKMGVSLRVKGVRKRCRNLVAKVNVFVGRIIEEHRAKRVENNGIVILGGDHESSGDFVDVLLDLEKENRLSDSDMIAVLWASSHLSLCCSWVRRVRDMSNTATASTPVLVEDTASNEDTTPIENVQEVEDIQEGVVESGGKNIEIDVMMIEHGLLQLEEAEIDAIV
uniref:Uncharacterized protein n=1 Tax=Fagus sylvatica TaxID=28930 RepID=A0A2N9IQQ4_FAGSY